MKILRLVVLIILVLTANSDPAPIPSPAPAPSNTATEFIRTSCETTQYPELCYESLSRYADAVKQDPALLAGIAIGVSLTRAVFMSMYVTNLTRQADYRADPRAVSALHDCCTVFRDAVGLIRGSMKQMLRLAGAGREELRFRMSNVQTWMSAALTNEDTCTDGFEGVVDGPMKMDVCDRTVKVKKVTSNALALVNEYVDKVIVP